MSKHNRSSPDQRQEVPDVKVLKYAYRRLRRVRGSHRQGVCMSKYVRRQDGVLVLIQEVSLEHAAHSSLLSRCTPVEAIQLLQQVRHPNCERIFDVFADGKRVYVVREWVRGPELIDTILSTWPGAELPPEATVAVVIRQVALALQHLHSLGIVHGNICFDSVRLRDQTQGLHALVLVDYAVPPEWLYDVIATFHGHGDQNAVYRAPELWRDRNAARTPATDMWAVGCLLFALLQGYFPFGDDVRRMGRRVVKARYSFEELGREHKPSPGAQDLIRSLLQVQPAKRLMADGVLHHPWLGSFRYMWSRQGLPARHAVHPVAGSDGVLLQRARCLLRRAVMLVVAGHRLCGTLSV